MKKAAIIILLLVVFSISGASFFSEAQTASGKEESVSVAGPSDKAERGFMNAAFGWTEIPKRIVNKTKESNPVSGLLIGAWQGTCKAFARTASGVSDLATFPMGRYDKPAILPDMPAAE